MNYTGATVATQISSYRFIIMICSLNRADRLPFLLSRWRGVISLAVFADESELYKLHSILNAFTTQRRIIFSFYIRKRITSSIIPTFVAPKGKAYSFKDGIYPMNILRDMSIESIDTSHYVALDIDAFVSSTLQENIEKNRELLSDHRNILVLPLFEMSRSGKVKTCMSSNRCKSV